MAQSTKIPNMRNDFDPKGEDQATNGMLEANAKDSLFDKNDAEKEYVNSGGVPKQDLGGLNTRK